MRILLTQRVWVSHLDAGPVALQEHAGQMVAPHPRVHFQVVGSLGDRLHGGPMVWQVRPEDLAQFPIGKCFTIELTDAPAPAGDA